MTRRCIAVHAAVGSTYPAYVSINYDEQREKVEITVRGEHHIDDMGWASPGFEARIELSPFDFRRLANSIAFGIEDLPDPMRKAASDVSSEVHGSST